MAIKKGNCFKEASIIHRLNYVIPLNKESDLVKCGFSSGVKINKSRVSKYVIMKS